MPCLSTYTRYAFETAASRKRKFSSLFLRLMWWVKNSLCSYITSATLRSRSFTSLSEKNDVSAEKFGYALPCLSTYTRYAFETAASRKRKFSSLFLRLMWWVKNSLCSYITSATLRSRSFTSLSENAVSAKSIRIIKMIL